jgi:hypothetical protein
MGYRFDEVARTERYFTASILPHLLMSDNFAGLKALFNHLEICPENHDSEEFEVVSELDPLRDGSVYNSTVKSLFNEYGRMAVPDLFLRWGKSILVVEAKFFTDPVFDSIGEQIGLQKKAIESVREQTIYNDKFSINYLILAINSHEETKAVNKAECFLFKTWSEITEVLKKCFERSTGNSEDIHYGINLLEASISRARKEFCDDNTRKISYRIIKTFEKLLSEIPVLISEEKLYVGITGGEKKLKSMTIEEFKNRGHYKVSKVCWTDNWIRLDIVLGHYFNLFVVSE